MGMKPRSCLYIFKCVIIVVAEKITHIGIYHYHKPTAADSLTVASQVAQTR